MEIWRAGWLYPHVGQLYLLWASCICIWGTVLMWQQALLVQVQVLPAIAAVLCMASVRCLTGPVGFLKGHQVIHVCHQVRDRPPRHACLLHAVQQDHLARMACSNVQRGMH